LIFRHEVCPVQLWNYRPWWVSGIKTAMSAFIKHWTLELILKIEFLEFNTTEGENWNNFLWHFLSLLDSKSPRAETPSPCSKTVHAGIIRKRIQSYCCDSSVSMSGVIFFCSCCLDTLFWCTWWTLMRYNKATSTGLEQACVTGLKPIYLCFLKVSLYSVQFNMDLRLGIASIHLKAGDS